MGQFLTDTAELFIAKKVVEEERVNAVPYLVKLYVDQNLETLNKAGEELEKSIKQSKE